MSIKDFSQKNSVALFYSAIVLLVLLIGLGAFTFLRVGQRGPGSLPPGANGQNTAGQDSLQTQDNGGSQIPVGTDQSGNY